MSAVSQEERKTKGRSTVVVHLLLLKISLVKFSLSQRLAARNQGLQGVKGRRGRPRDQKEKKKKGGGGGGGLKQKRIERANSPSKAGPRSPICA